MAKRRQNGKLPLEPPRDSFVLTLILTGCQERERERERKRDASFTAYGEISDLA